MKPVMDWISSLFSSDRRTAKRYPDLPVVAFYWDGAAPTPHSIRDIDDAGMYLLTERRWYPNTLITMTLQRIKAAENDPDRVISVNARVARAGSDGVGFEFIVPMKSGSQETNHLLTNESDRESLARFLKRLWEDSIHA